MFVTSRARDRRADRVVSRTSRPTRHAHAVYVVLVVIDREGRLIVQVDPGDGSQGRKLERRFLRPGQRRSDHARSRRRRDERPLRRRGRRDVHDGAAIEPARRVGRWEYAVAIAGSRSFPGSRPELLREHDANGASASVEGGHGALARRRPQDHLRLADRRQRPQRRDQGSAS